jgi:formate dehydrogenase major subunit
MAVFPTVASRRPCPDEDYSGTPYLSKDGFNFPDEKVRFVPADLEETGELLDGEYPLILTTGRVLYHFHTGTLTRCGDYEPHRREFRRGLPRDRGPTRIEHGEYVGVTSRRGSTTVRAHVTDCADRGVVFMSMHFATGAVNELTQVRSIRLVGSPSTKSQAFGCD